ncbi:homoserine kinase [Peptoniphilus sp. HMSC075B08]|uniref:homoserine kinase n=1 Tax=Peptoniphilus sp. HMSC075B08 TaxID=1739525 RepID=UPI0008A62837|nr:homoserine kinase [Peptoniphilus sp. HMSC075B08]OFO61160.1 homoserine kinase [Peptoniphilus sp. HMSC075B08]
MKFLSTRNSNLKISGREAIVKGISEDGGLFVPESFPAFDIMENLDLSYTDLAHKILSLYLTDFDKDDLLGLIEKSYASFEDEIAKVSYQKDFYLELYHGRTSAFKDFALCLLPNLLAYAKKSLGIKDKTLILTATSGDTGKAALEGFYNTEDIDILVLYPTEGVSSIQKAQMDTTGSLNSKVISIDGNFDDAQSAVKKIFNDAKIKEELKKENIYLSSANSINIGRLLPQIVYYFYSYADLVKNKKISGGEKISYCVPTGNFGDILAGYYAKEMGLPIDKLVIASNDNNVLTDFFTSGRYDANRDLVKTISPSMDILVSSNLERLIFHKSSDAIVKEKMADLKDKGIFEFKGDFHEFLCGFAKEDETRETIKKVFEEEKYLMDPHTGVAKNIVDKLGLDKTVILSTASPYKFSSTVLEALGENLSDDEFKNIDLLHEKTGVKIPSEIKKLKDKKILHKTKILKNEIEEEVLKFARRGKRISVPASSANLGPGFDVLGLALDLSNTCEFKLSDDKEEFENNLNSNLIYKAYKYAFDFYGEEALPVDFNVDTNVPLSRGLGSSASCIVMGIMAAFDVMKRDFDKKEILKLATKMEGHPDNVAPAIFGNAVASILKDDQVYLEEFEVSNNFKFLAIIPDFKLPTKEARDALPKTYSKEDAVFNLSRLSMVILSLISGNEENLKVALDDKIHEPYRLKLIPEIDEIEKIIDDSEALGHYLSGAGSTIMVVLKASDKTSEDQIKNKLDKLLNSYEVRLLDIDEKGAFII